MIVLGIDPGLSGGYALVSDKVCIGYGMMPVLTKIYGKGKQAKRKSSVDVARLRDVILAIAKPDLTIIELVGALPGQGSVSGFTFGKGVGKLTGMAEALDWSYVEVRPQAWKAIILKDTLRDKEAAISYCKHKHKNVNLIPPRHRVPSDGIADSVCMADYGAYLHENDLIPDQACPP
jgi:crossover junction endodeoxyribonuclease RuvC